MKVVGYILVFAVIFAGITSTIILLNNKYVNIFAMNFEPETKLPGQEVVTKVKLNTVSKEILENLKKDVITELEDNLIDSISTLTSEVVTKTEVQKTLIDSLKKLENDQRIKDQEIAKKNSEVKKLAEQVKKEKEDEYNTWISSTVKLYESMDSKKAAKIIIGYDDSVARDIIYSMKKKKAAQILANLSSEQIVKLTQAK